MYRLYGIKTTATPNSYTGKSEHDRERNLIATFDTRDMVHSFVCSCKLKTPIRNTWMNDEPFKKKSLLGGYGYIEIEEYVKPYSVPHNPSLGINPV